MELPERTLRFLRTVQQSRRVVDSPQHRRYHQSRLSYRLGPKGPVVNNRVGHARSPRVIRGCRRTAANTSRKDGSRHQGRDRGKRFCVLGMPSLRQNRATAPSRMCHPAMAQSDNNLRFASSRRVTGPRWRNPAVGYILIGRGRETAAFAHCINGKCTGGASSLIAMMRLHNRTQIEVFHRPVTGRNALLAVHPITQQQLKSAIGGARVETTAGHHCEVFRPCDGDRLFLRAHQRRKR
jgi:hypothetical protein